MYIIFIYLHYIYLFLRGRPISDLPFESIKDTSIYETRVVYLLSTMQILESYHWQCYCILYCPKWQWCWLLLLGRDLLRGEGRDEKGDWRVQITKNRNKDALLERFTSRRRPLVLSVSWSVSLKILTHVCFRYLIPNGKTNVPEELPPSAEAYYKQNTLGSKSDSDKLICNTSNAF